MITTILGISFATWLIFGLLFILIVIYDELSVTSHDKTAIVFGLICAIGLLNCGICRLAFSKELDEEALANVKERYFEMIERCPLNVGECEIKWLNYHADSLKAEYKVQRNKYE